MVFQNITMNLTALESITPPNISISGSSSFSNIISVANATTNDYLIFASMFLLLVILYLTLSDKTPLQDYGYSDLRALNIALAISTQIGLTIVSVGWSNNFVSVGTFGTSWLLSFILIKIYEEKE